MKKRTIALGVVFAVAACGTAYEAKQLNDLVWSAPGTGDVEVIHAADIVDFVLELERTRSLFYREDLLRKLTVNFDTKSDIPLQVCIEKSYDIAGIFTLKEESPLLQKHINDNPVFIDNRKAFFTRYYNKLEYNSRLVSAAYEQCGEHLQTAYAPVMQKIIQARRNTLN